MTEDQKVQSINSAFSHLARIGDAKLRGQITACWLRIWEESPWEELVDCPFNPHFPDVSLVSHINCLCDLVLACADIMEKHNPGLSLDRDYLLTGVLLHDLSKMVEIEPGQDGPGFSPLNRHMPHSTYGAMVAMAQGLDTKVANIILSHTKLTGAVPDSAEAVLLHYLDYGMADVLRAKDGLPLIMIGGSTFGKK